ncbi:hypothetical protein ACFWFF_05275 [Streptomyces sp. NPDC060223]|uniref:hypothetical protein n=1 Tax=unclassified Streptomyces TaxID=2593676 RepID=UPI00362C793D
MTQHQGIRNTGESSSRASQTQSRSAFRSSHCSGPTSVDGTCRSSTGRTTTGSRNAERLPLRTIIRSHAHRPRITDVTDPPQRRQGRVLHHIIGVRARPQDAHRHRSHPRPVPLRQQPTRAAQSGEVAALGPQALSFYRVFS